jgi:hypothetical protein
MQVVEKEEVVVLVVVLVALKLFFHSGFCSSSSITRVLRFSSVRLVVPCLPDFFSLISGSDYRGEPLGLTGGA